MTYTGTQPTTSRRSPPYGPEATIATILASGLPPATMTALILQALAVTGVSPQAATAAIQIVGLVAAPPAAAPVAAAGAAGVAGVATVDVARTERQQQAAFLLNAAQRINVALTKVQVVHTGTDTEGPSRVVHAELRSGLGDALNAERRYKTLHDAAAVHRRAAAAQIDQAATVHGAILGWYLGKATNHTPVCVAAAGHNFGTWRRPLPGWPGTTHALCACHAGPPHPPGPSVDDVTGPLIARGLS